MKRHWRHGAGLVVLLVVITGLWLGSRTPDSALRDRIRTSLRSLSLHDAELSRDVLLARASLLSNYDPIADRRRSLVADIAALRAALASGTPEARGSLGQDVAVLVGAMDQKLATTEDFKSRQAILRNSLAYLTHEAPTLQPLLRDPQRAATFGRLSYALLRYLDMPSPDFGREIDLLLDALEMNGVADSDLATLIRHGRKIVSTLPVVDRLTDSVETTPTHELIARLDASVQAYGDRIEARTQPFLDALFIASVVFVGYIVWLLLRVQAHAANLGRANESLRESEGRYRAITESAQEAIVTVDATGLIRSWNPGAAAVFGRAAHDVLGRPSAELVCPTDRARHAELIRHLTHGATPEDLISPRVWKGVTANAEEIPLDVSLARWSSADGVYVTAIMRDVTERERLRQQVRQAELTLTESSRVNAVGMLALGVAHEIKNPVQAILGGSDVLSGIWRDLTRLFDGRAADFEDTLLGGLPLADVRHDGDAAIERLTEQSALLNTLVRELGEFGGSAGVLHPGPFDAREAVARAARLLQYLVRKRSPGDRFILSLPEDLPAAWGNLVQFQQVAINLIANALESLPVSGPGGVRVTMRQAEAAATLVLIVEDDGAGIPAERLERLGRHFETTKAASGGSGLGLAISRRILDACGGSLSFESTIGVGTRAIAVLQVASAATDLADPDLRPREAVTSHGK